MRREQSDKTTMVSSDLGRRIARGVSRSATAARWMLERRAVDMVRP